MKFYHGSRKELNIGATLRARSSIYEHGWGGSDFYKAIESARPKEQLAHKDSVFMTDNIDDLGIAGDCDFCYRVEPIGNFVRNDMSWSREISFLIEEDGEALDSTSVRRAAQGYWSGKPLFEGEAIWEYRAESFRVVSLVDKYGNDILPEGDVYGKVQSLHGRPEDFIDGDLGDRIEQFSHFIIADLDISDLHYDKFYIDEDKVEEFVVLFKSGSDIPPIVYDEVNNSIIDGAHRLNAALKLGLCNIKSYIGAKEYYIGVSDDNEYQSTTPKL